MRQGPTNRIRVGLPRSGSRDKGLIGRWTYWWRSTNTEDLLSIDIVDELDNDRPRVSRIERIVEGDPQPPQSYPAPMLCLLESHGTLLMVRRKMNSKGYPVYMSGKEVSVEMGHRVGSSEFQVVEADLKRLLWA